MTVQNSSQDLAPSAEALEASLTRTLGALIGGATLTRMLGYPTQAAFRKALSRNRLPVRVFNVEGRRGRFALTRDLAAWLYWQESRAINSPPPAPAAQAGGTRR